MLPVPRHFRAAHAIGSERVNPSHYDVRARRVGARLELNGQSGPVPAGDRPARRPGEVLDVAPRSPAHDRHSENPPRSSGPAAQDRFVLSEYFGEIGAGRLLAEALADCLSRGGAGHRQGHRLAGGRASEIRGRRGPRGAIAADGIGSALCGRSRQSRSLTTRSRRLAASNRMTGPVLRGWGVTANDDAIAALRQTGAIAKPRSRREVAPSQRAGRCTPRSARP